MELARQGTLRGWRRFCISPSRHRVGRRLNIAPVAAVGRNRTEQEIETDLLHDPEVALA